MPKDWCNEAERFLVRHWPEAFLMQKGMEKVREQYKAIFERIATLAQEKHPELDRTGVFVTQFWTPGYVFLSREAWRDKAYKHAPPGLYISSLRLELLAADDEPRPAASIWVPMKKVNADPKLANKAVGGAARRLLTNEEFGRCIKQQDDGEDLLCYDLPETRQQLLDMLLDGEAERFVDCVVSHLDLLARFTPVLDQVLGGKVSAKK